MEGLARIKMQVNGENVQVEVDPDTPLVYVLRNKLGLFGTKVGCAKEQCGACAVLVDDKKQLSCSTPVGQFEGKQITTVESGSHERLDAVRKSFVRAGAAQCGYCIPGMVIASTALLLSNQRPSEAEIKAALQQHLCRCGTHLRVIAAVRDMAKDA
jgi:nicotinate dehydrogenase subunit A